VLAFDTDVYVIVADVADPATAEPLGAAGFVSLIAPTLPRTQSYVTTVLVSPFLVL
jgi:hypothetical protein